MFAQSSEAVEYTDCFSAEELDPPQRVSWYNPKQSDGEVPVLLELWSAEHPFIAIDPRSTLVQNGSTWLGPIYGLNRTNCIFMLNWIVWIRTVWLNWIA